MKRLLLPLFVLCLAMVPTWLMAQQTVTGTVKDSDSGEALAGATIRVEGTTTGGITDEKGGFSVQVPNENASLLVSYYGYQDQRVELAGRSSVEVSLSSSANTLDDVVVVGYTTRKRGELTGSISTIDSEVIEQTTNKDLTKSLAGRIPGLIVNDRGGYPGSTNDVTLLIRGKSTLNNNAPLILIDGIPAASFSHLTPQDIASLSVLKDGAAAIYGARAANGVIVITTKRGNSLKPQISLTSSFNLSSFSNFPKLMTSEQYAIYRNEGAERNGTQLPFTQEQINNYAAGNDPINFPSTDWADLTFADYSPEIRNTVTVSGGSDKVSYFVSGDQMNQV